MKKIIIMMMLIAPLAAMAQKFGHVDTQSLMYSLPEFDKIQRELRAVGQQYENELSKMQEELKVEADEYDMEKATMSAEKQKETENRLNDMYNRIQQYATASQQTFEKQQEEKFGALKEKVKTAIQKVGKAGQYSYIFDKDTPLYIGANTKDLTEEVRAELKKMK